MGPESEPIRVLVVDDDDAALAELTATFLARHSIQAETATTGIAGLRRLGVADPNEHHGTEGGADSDDGERRNEPEAPTDGEPAAQTDGGATADIDGGSGVESGPGIDSDTDGDPNPGPDSRTRIDCVVSDQDMPDLTGIEFLRAVRERAPTLPFVLFTGEGSDEIATAIAAVFTEGGTETREAAFLTKDGREISHEFNGTRVTDEDGTVLGLVGTGRDITDRKEHEQELEHQNDRLEEFASVLSHDLRNPLGVATGYLDLARETGDPGDFERVEEAHERIERLIERILAEARYGRVVTDLGPVSLAAASEAAFATVETDGAVLDVTVEDGTTLVADDERLRQLLENLFRNSVEHSSTSSRPSADDCVEHGGSGVSIEVGALSDGSGFCVVDDGPGIDPTEREAVFDYGCSTAEAGTGFGLAIVARIADAHGWEISVTESDRGGARFEITGVETT